MRTYKNVKEFSFYLGVEESGQPRLLWEQKHAVMASAGSNPATQTIKNFINGQQKMKKVEELYHYSDLKTAFKNCDEMYVFESANE